MENLVVWGRVVWDFFSGALRIPIPFIFGDSNRNPGPTGPEKPPIDHELKYSLPPKEHPTHLSKLPWNKKLNFFGEPFYVLPKS